MGPTHGVHKSPRLSPSMTPPIKPEPELRDGENLIKELTIFSKIIPKGGKSCKRPNRNITMTEIFLSRSEDIPVSLTIDDKNKVKKVRLTIKPITTPKGLLFPLSIPPDNIIGNTGNIQGERMVTKPAMKAKRIRIIILNYYHYSNS